jgi:hypothetical protein
VACKDSSIFVTIPGDQVCWKKRLSFIMFPFLRTGQYSRHSEREFDEILQYQCFILHLSTSSVLQARYLSTLPHMDDSKRDLTY